MDELSVPRYSAPSRPTAIGPWSRCPACRCLCCTIRLMRVHLITAESPASRRLRRGRLIQFPQLTMPLIAALTPREHVSHTALPEEGYMLAGLSNAERSSGRQIRFAHVQR